jgi:hypothetical protein
MYLCYSFFVVIKEGVLGMANTERVSTFLSPEIKAKVEEKAKAKGLTLSAYIRTLLIEETKKEKK